MIVAKVNGHSISFEVKQAYEIYVGNGFERLLSEVNNLFRTGPCSHALIQPYVMVATTKA